MPTFPAVEMKSEEVAVSVVSTYERVCPAVPDGRESPAMRHEPEMEKHPPARSMPRAKVEVAAVPVMLRYGDSMPPVNVVVAGEPKVKAPLVPLIAAAATVEVAEYVEVARKKLPPAFLNVHALFVPSASAICGPVDEATVSTEDGVVVPIPTERPVVKMLELVVDAYVHTSGELARCVQFLF